MTLEQEIRAATLVALPEQDRHELLYRWAALEIDRPEAKDLHQVAEDYIRHGRKGT